MVAQNDFARAHEPSGADPKFLRSQMFPVPLTIWLLLADCVLILAYGLLGLLSLAGAISAIPDILRIDRDWALPETLNYAKWLALITFSALLFDRQRQAIFLAIGIMCVIALLDNSLQFHETLSMPLLSILVPGLALPLGVGEIIFMGLEGVLVLGPIVYGWVKAPPRIRRQVAPLLLLFGGAAFCAVAVDYAHTLVSGSRLLSRIFGILEDGGEMVFLSLAVSYAAGLVLRSKPDACS